MKMCRAFFLAVAFCCLLAGGTVGAQKMKSAPRRFVDKGACPFECCTYREWKAEKATKLYRRPRVGSGLVGTVRAGENVQALTGEVHTVAARMIVKKQHEQYRPGDVLWVYTYLGEGQFKVWYKGRMYQEDLLFSPYGGTVGKRCELTDYCWGELESELQSTWWIKIKDARGRTGWTTQSENFSGADACG